MDVLILLNVVVNTYGIKMYPTISLSLVVRLLGNTGESLGSIVKELCVGKHC